MFEIQTSVGKIVLAQSPAVIFAAQYVSVHFVLVRTDLIHSKTCKYENPYIVSKRSHVECNFMQTLRYKHC